MLGSQFYLSEHTREYLIEHKDAICSGAMTEHLVAIGGCHSVMSFKIAHDIFQDVYRKNLVRFHSGSVFTKMSKKDALLVS